jgi:hypothetical protein
MIARTAACLAGLVISCWPPVASAADCTIEAALLAKEQSELPRLDVASPADRPPYCITLETLMAFAGRVKAHVATAPVRITRQPSPTGPKPGLITPNCSAVTAAGARGDFRSATSMGGASGTFGARARASPAARRAGRRLPGTSSISSAAVRPCRSRIPRRRS